MTQAQATYTSTFVRYDEVPTHIADKVIQELNAEAVESNSNETKYRLKAGIFSVIKMSII